MRLKLTGNKCIVTREPGDPLYYGVVNAAGESRLLHAIKKQLNAQGYDLIKKRMHKDGHLVDDMQQYLRSRNTSGDVIAIYNPSWALRGAEVDFNNGQVILAVAHIGAKHNEN